MKTKNLRLIGIAMASGACWWCATARSPLPSPVSALAAPNARVNAETAHACQSVVYQMVAIQQIVKDERQSGTIRPLAAMDELVGEESRIDTSKCPDDFRQAYSHFVGAEDSWRNHVYGDMIGKSEILAGAVAISSGMMWRPSKPRCKPWPRRPSSMG
jgi:hypothetical protein